MPWHEAGTAGHKDARQRWAPPRWPKRAGGSLGSPGELHFLEQSLLGKGWVLLVERTAKAMGCTAHVKPQIGGTAPPPPLLPEQPCLCKRRGIPVQNKASVIPRRLFCTPQPPCQILQIRSVAKPGSSRSCRWDGGWSPATGSPLAAQCCGSLIRCCYLDLEGANTSRFL